ncbi:Hypothetical predicted protein [Scomber scombrus]|uniref:Uncharacterized protein n=1 Tax=Scomber scombrus TaxID=13677 RepID=A0AAV1Q850_SCOSC
MKEMKKDILQKPVNAPNLRAMTRMTFCSTLYPTIPLFASLFPRLQQCPREDVVVRPEPSSASHWVSQWERSSTALTTQVPRTCTSSL